MGITPKFDARNKSGRLFITEHEGFVAYLHTLPESVELVVKPRANSRNRSTNQNRYYWGVVISLISEHTGYTDNECHEILKTVFLSEKVALHTTHGDKIIDTPKSTSTLNTAEMEDYLESVRGWCSVELGLSIPLPSEVEEV